MLLLLTRGADVDLRTSIYGHPLIAASEVGDAEIVQLLLDSGANVDARRRRNPLIAALNFSNIDLARLLIHNKVLRPLQLVTVQLVPLLLKRGAELKQRCTSHLYRKIPYEIASERDDEEMLRMMEGVSVRNSLKQASPSNISDRGERPSGGLF
ncbi:hypothetical protein CKAH01_11875 [Colletotrichum kahawae]|uniref:Uncharacterized protein n=1 Tax=Colletotrichum kahawae TaxID=34407 RepID=A0AAE0DBT8_COLKA|nr:hypothetical protein CKAH01_11875 [Colletotrichum kahawae]